MSTAERGGAGEKGEQSEREGLSFHLILNIAVVVVAVVVELARVYRTESTIRVHSPLPCRTDVARVTYTTR
jgi:hypothetical protein